jgi:hypothetical protein
MKWNKRRREWENTEDQKSLDGFKKNSKKESKKNS